VEGEGEEEEGVVEEAGIKKHIHPSCSLCTLDNNTLFILDFTFYNYKMYNIRNILHRSIHVLKLKVFSSCWRKQSPITSQEQ
jgi:hypothetical protein